MEKNTDIVFGKAAGQLIHDVRNFLNTIIGFSSLMENSETNFENSSYLKKISQAGFSIEKILSNINDFISTDIDLETEEISLNDLLKNIIESNNTNFIEKNIALNFLIDEQIIVKTSREIFEKLIDCLFEFSFKGLRSNSEKKIDIIVKSDNNMVTLLYSDNSMPVVIKNIFFNTEEILNSRRGLSLFFITKFIELLKGDISYLNGKNWEKIASGISNINKSHGFLITLPSALL